MKPSRVVLLGYCALLAASLGFDALRTHELPLTAGGRRVEIGATAPRFVEVIEHGAGGCPVVVLHGCPGSARDLDAFARCLAASRRVDAISLPGFGASDTTADFSAPAQADVVLRTADALGFSRFHVVAHSLGGAVAIELAARAPQRIASVTLVAAIGVQELELFSRYGLNHAVHEAQRVALTLARWLVPHFGWFERQPFDLAYARAFCDTDQRPLRAQLLAIEQPVLIVHGDKDFLVAPAVAREHERIVPQSELELQDGGHFDVFMRPQAVAAPIMAFEDAVDRGIARTRTNAEPERVARAQLPFDPSTIPPFTGPALVLILFVLAIGTFASEDLACIGAGLLVAEGRLPFVAAAAACAFGIWFGDVLLFVAGRTIGRSIARRRPFSWVLSADALERGATFFEKNGVRSIFVSRFTPGLRLPTYVAAGVTKMPLVRFASWFALAACVWTPLLVGVAAIFGDRALAALEAVDAHPLLAIVAVIATLVVVERVVLRLLTWRGRRLLLASWRRLTRWEFWPPWAFYPPVLVYVAWLAVKHRGLAVLTAANPGIYASGIVGESKSAIMRLLAHAPEHVASHVLIEHGGSDDERMARAERFMTDQRVAFPVVVKPDIGQRGSGVRIVDDRVALERALLQARAIDVIVQEFVAGLEFGVFYVREPNASAGRIFSITEKRLPGVRGDGTRSLETLILADARAVCVASTYFAQHAETLETVPARDAYVQLARIGNHCRGAVFLDGAWVKTDALERAIDALCMRAEGFHFGRFDLKVGAVEDLQRGVGFKIVELNGLTSEATHIYDPRTSLFTAYRVLFEQWRIAFAIAVANKANGAPVIGLKTIAREWLQDRRRNRVREGL